ncbi:hypothetical protein PIROE2DRAFT_11977 [Piromyces sp. E2]|nr:hypothetical protein PIROE2DRAFT_11977 [Piromyces sp. E2]|eukprot:OUM61908.1 hypothetical protein PIROE2DRAFT_11977 [Piromyces sp. E2]
MEGIEEQAVYENLGNFIPTQQDLADLRQDAVTTAQEILDRINNECISHQDLDNFANQLYQNISENITKLFEENMKNNKDKSNDNNRAYDRLTTPKPFGNNEDDTSLLSSTDYDLDHDVVMKSHVTNSFSQVPDPGCFDGNSTETELFCELCEATFKTHPYKRWPEDIKVNFVTSRLKGAARNWYLVKYPANTVPASMKELLEGLKVAFNDVGSNKLAKIKLMNLKQTYGEVNKYFEEFRNLTNKFNFGQEALALLYYNGLHPKYQEEIQKMDNFPITLETIATKSILFENTLKTKNQIKRNTGTHKKFNKKHSKNTYHNNNYKNYYKNNYNNNYKNNQDQNMINKVQRIKSKN